MIENKLLHAFGDLLDSVVAATPKVVVGILLAIVGLLLAKVVEIVLRFILTRIRFDKIAERTGIDRALQRIGLRQQLEVFIPRLAYFLIILILARTAADTLGLLAISGAIGAFFSYLPNIIAALLLILLGSTFGNFAGDVVRQSAANSGIDFAPALGKLVSGLIIFVVSMMAVGQMKIDTAIVRIVTSFVLGAAALAFGVSFGLGTREVVRNITAGFYTRKFLEIGSQVTIAGSEGTLVEINATHTILQAEDREISIANSTFLKTVAQSRPPIVEAVQP